MAHQEVSMGLALILVTMLWYGATAQSSDCTNVLISMSPCLNYISGNSSTPSSGCCTQLGTVVRSQPQCLCEVLNGGGSNLGLNINQTQALALPTACNVQTPPVSRCNGKNWSQLQKLQLFSLKKSNFCSPFSDLFLAIAAASPSGSPGSTPSSPKTNPGTFVESVWCHVCFNWFSQSYWSLHWLNVDAGGGSKTVPSPGDGSSDANSNKLAVSMLFCLLFIGSYVSTFNVAWSSQIQPSFFCTN